MKKIAVLILALLMLVALAACGGQTEPAGSDTTSDQPASSNPTSDSAEANQPTENIPDDENAEATVCTPEDYDKAVDALMATTGGPLPTYSEVVELFGGVEGTVNTDTEYEGYSYYNWTDGKRTALVTFKVDGDTQTYFAITGDVN